MVDGITLVLCAAHAVSSSAQPSADESRKNMWRRYSIGTDSWQTPQWTLEPVSKDCALHFHASNLFSYDGTKSYLMACTASSHFSSRKDCISVLFYFIPTYTSLHADCSVTTYSETLSFPRAASCYRRGLTSIPFRSALRSVQFYTSHDMLCLLRR